MKEIKITPNEAGQRLDRFLCKYFNNTTRTNIFKLIRKKVFKVNGVRVKEDYFLELGDNLQVYLADETFAGLIKEVEKISAEEVKLNIIFEDDDILIVNKPSGMLTHPDANEYKNTLASKVQIYLRHLATRTFKPAPVHRLDKNTSGMVIFAKNYESLKRYNELMRKREIEKYYICVVSGNVLRKGEVIGYITKDEQKNKVTLSKNGRDESKFCHTEYEPIKSFGDYTLVEVKLITGRSHQIRASLSYIGHPIVGDLKYGGKKVGNINNQLLHAYKLKVDGKEFISQSREINEFVKKHS